MRGQLPSLAEVERASADTIRRWYRFLPLARNHTELEVVNAVVDRFIALGGMTPQASKKIGWDPNTG